MLGYAEQLGLVGLERQPQPAEVQLRPLEDFEGDLDAWSDHVEEHRKYVKLKQEMEVPRANLVRSEHVAAPVLVVLPGLEPAQPDQLLDESLSDSNTDISFEILKGHCLTENPARLIVGKKAAICCKQAGGI